MEHAWYDETRNGSGFEGDGSWSLIGTAGRVERALFLVRNLLWAVVALMVVAGFVDDRSEWMLFILGGSIVTCCVWGCAADKAARRNKRNLRRHQRQQDPVASDASAHTDPKTPSWDRQVHTANV